MERNNLIKQLNNLKETKAGGRVRQAWVRDNRSVLMEKARHDLQSMPVGREGNQLRLALDLGAGWHRMMRPAVALAAIVLIVFGGSVATVSASYNSLPGDTLYSVKILSEGAQLTLAAGRENKARMRMDFAGRRLDEVAKLVDSPDPDKDRKIGQAMGYFNKNIQTVNKEIDEIKQAQSKKMVEVAKDVDRRAEEYEEAIKDTISKVSVENQKEAKKAKAAVEEVSVKAVEVLVEKHLSGEGEGVTEEEVIEKISKKIKKAEDIIAEAVVEEGQDLDESEEGSVDEGVSKEEEEVEEVDNEDAETGDESANGSDELDGDSEEGGEEPADGEEAADQLKTAVEEARVLLESKDLAGALDKVKEASTLVSAIEEAEEEAEGGVAEEAAQDGDSGESFDDGSSVSSSDIIIDDTDSSEDDTDASTTTEEIINNQ